LITRIFFISHESPPTNYEKYEYDTQEQGIYSQCVIKTYQISKDNTRHTKENRYYAQTYFLPIYKKLTEKQEK
jgi:hypothetical protein